MLHKKWVIRQADKEAASAISEQFNIDPFLAFLLVSRGLTDDLAVQEFLHPGQALCAPEGFADMEAAAARLQQALDSGERICVYGDYDCDGVTATALLYSFLEAMGGNVIYYIPDRETEGYGLNKGAIDTLAAKGTGLIVTVDNGISSVDEAEYIYRLGMQLVVTDHHQVGEKLPRAEAVVNPHRTDNQLPFTDFCGVGVAFKLACCYKNLGFGYPYEKDVTLPVKRSVTALTKEIDEGIVYGIEDADEFDEEEDFIGQTDLKPQAFDKRSSDEKRARGIAYHKFLENWDFNEKNVDNELIRQLSQGVLGEEQAKLLNTNTLKRITKLKIFEELKGYELYREKQFIAGFKARDLGYADTDGEMLVQGVIDLLAVKGNKAIIVDYKDSGRSGEELLSAYRPQLVLYKKAVEKILNLKVTRAVLLSLRAGEAVDVE